MFESKKIEYDYTKEYRCFEIDYDDARDSSFPSVSELKEECKKIDNIIRSGKITLKCEVYEIEEFYLDGIRGAVYLWDHIDFGTIRFVINPETLSNPGPYTILGYYWYEGDDDGNLEIQTVEAEIDYDERTESLVVLTYEIEDDNYCTL